MRTFLISIGLILAPSVAAAQCPMTPQAHALAHATPLGQYAQKVVNRVDIGIAKAKGAAGGDEVLDIFNLHFLSLVQSIFYMLVDTDLRAVEYKRDLTTINSCLHYDLAILEAKIEEVRCETLEAYKNKSSEGILLLKSVAGFLNQRYAHLVKGGLEPEHEDASWPYYYLFDEPTEGWCCVLDQKSCQVQTSEECGNGNNFYPTKDACITDSICAFADEGEAAPRYTKECPFDSDYLTSSTNGYGCDISVLKKIPSGIIPGVDAEIEALTTLAKTRDDFLEDIDHIKDTTVAMDNVMNQNMLSDKQREALKHFGETTVDNSEHKRVYSCAEEEPWIRIPLRSAFFFGKDHLEIWKTYFRQQNEWAEQREFPDYLKNPNEFFNEEDRRNAMESDWNTFKLITIPRDYVRSLWKQMHHWQAISESGILPKTQDATLQIRDAIAPVRSAMMKNAKLITTSGGGIRKFVINYAYFLRRSCIYRPCNTKLDTIMKVLLSDECFPYTSGENGSWESCKKAVEKL